VPRNVARISEYAANSSRPPSPSEPGSSQSVPSTASTAATVGTAEPAGKTRSSPARTSCVDPSARVSVAGCSNTTVVAAGNVRPSGGVSAGRPSACQCRIRNTTGTASAVNFSQYWNACTNVMARMPPSATFAVTTPPTSSAPTTYGPPVTVVSVSPAPCICGTR
jgi:hypothetical protein